MGKHPLPGYGPVTHGNRLVRTRMPGGVGAGGEIPPATRLGKIRSCYSSCSSGYDSGVAAPQPSLLGALCPVRMLDPSVVTTLPPR